MDRDDRSPRTLLGRIARAAVLLSSGSLAALLVLRSGAPGCGGGPTAGDTTPTPVVTPAAAPKSEAAPVVKENAGPGPSPRVNEDVAPGPSPAANAGPGPLPTANAAPAAGEAKREAKPRFLPASKSGVLFEGREEPQQAGPR